MTDLVTWRRFARREVLLTGARDFILESARQAIANRNCFRIVLAGGSTPAILYQSLAKVPAEWQHWHVYYGDERCLPPDDSDRNSTMASGCWLERITPPANVYPVPAEHGPETAADIYSKTIASALPFDVVLLGAGEDGHTASLFPGDEYPPDMPVVGVHNAAKPPSERVSLNYPALCTAAHVLFLVTGRSKAAMVARWRSGEDLPVNHVFGRKSTQVYLDADAAGM